jgi:hypothetical protein
MSHLRSRFCPNWVGSPRFMPECLAQHPFQTRNSLFNAAAQASTPLKLLRLRPDNTWSVAAEACLAEAQRPRHPSWNIRPHTNAVEKRPLPNRSLFSAHTQSNARGPTQVGSIHILAVLGSLRLGNARPTGQLQPWNLKHSWSLAYRCSRSMLSLAMF